MANRVKLTICGTEYIITTDESTYYMEELARRVEKEMKDLLASPRVSTTMAAVLAALTYADHAQKAIDAADNLREQMKGYLDDNARGRAISDAASKEAAQLRHEVALLRQKVALLEKKA
ncbi:MAG: cell division protein ZapA [Oscillospiraceae bacterium]|nr:cell division protein ZapA [Oscillospiraceae bacterium]